MSEFLTEFHSMLWGDLEKFSHREGPLPREALCSVMGDTGKVFGQCQTEAKLQPTEDGLEQDIMRAILDQSEEVAGGFVYIDRAKFVPYLTIKEFFASSKMSPSGLMQLIMNKQIDVSRIEIGFEGDRPFLPEGKVIRRHPYLFSPIPIDNGQTCSAEYMIQTYNILSTLTTVERFYDFGVGCGYQMAHMLHLHKDAIGFGCDVHSDLIEQAQSNLTSPENLSPFNASRIHLSTNNALEEHAHFSENGPYNLIYFAFMNPDDFNPSTYSQHLADGGVMIVPVRGEKDDETGGFLRVYRKKGDDLEHVNVAKVGFVPAILPSAKIVED